MATLPSIPSIPYQYVRHSKNSSIPNPPLPCTSITPHQLFFFNKKIKQKRSNAINIRFYWISYRTHQGQLKIYWVPRSINLNNYHTKYLAPGHHRLMRPNFLPNNPHENLKNLVVMHLLRWAIDPHRLCAVHAEPGLNSRRHSAAVNSQ